MADKFTLDKIAALDAMRRERPKTPEEIKNEEWIRLVRGIQHRGQLERIERRLRYVRRMLQVIEDDGLIAERDVLEEMRDSVEQELAQNDTR